MKNATFLMIFLQKIVPSSILFKWPGKVMNSVNNLDTTDSIVINFQSHSSIKHKNDRK